MHSNPTPLPPTSSALWLSLDTVHTPMILPEVHLCHAIAESFLRTFLKKVYLPHMYRAHSEINVDNILSKLPRFDVSGNRVFWKMVAKLNIYCFIESYVNNKTQRFASTAKAQSSAIRAAYD